MLNTEYNLREIIDVLLKSAYCSDDLTTCQESVCQTVDRDDCQVSRIPHFPLSPVTHDLPGQQPKQQQHATHFSSTSCYKQFQRHLLENQPCIFSSQLTESWKCRKEWVTEDGKPNWDFLTSMFGTAMVPVSNCRVKYYNSQQKTEMSFAAYIEYWQSVIANNHNYEKCENLYLKDWHFMREFPLYSAYETPFCFESDWLNEFWLKRSDAMDDYRFVYMGPKDSWTPLHTDVFSSYSWSANICGLKKWILFAAEEEENLKDRWGKLAYDVTAPEMNDRNIYPNYHKIQRRLEIIQHPGEVVFIPSSWFHQQDTISVNHNWFNGFNIHIVWNSIKEMLRKVQLEIDDCKDMENWDNHCQIMLKSVYGMDIKEFCDMLMLIGKVRLEAIKFRSSSNQLDTVTNEEEETKAIRDAIIVFDLGKVRWFLKKIETEFPSVVSEPTVYHDMTTKIETVLDEIFNKGG